jgi:hypothetical protein
MPSLPNYGFFYFSKTVNLEVTFFLKWTAGVGAAPHLKERCEKRGTAGIAPIYSPMILTRTLFLRLPSNSP